jgi:3-hydroxymyristoyl/3-hydroxydecanoyl-(acyl carrier protein) dehydratase
MVLIDEIQWVDEESKTCRCSFTIKENFFLADEAGIPETVMVEIMAQASACLKGWIDVHRGLPVKIGYLVGIDLARFHESPRPGDPLSVDAEMTEEMSDYFRFKCRISKDTAEMAEAVLSFMIPG